MFKLGNRNKRAENAPQVKRETQLAVLADIGSVRHGLHIVAQSYDQLFVELIRRLPRGQTFAVTSTDRSEGRTSAAASIACAAARHGKQVLLIDADLRRPKLQELFADTGIVPSPGLVEMLIGNLASPDQVVQRSTIPGLHVITAGRMQVSDASALLDSATMHRFLKGHLAQMADIVIIDTPACGSDEPGTKIISHVDGVIFVMRVGHTSMAQIRNQLARLHRDGTRVIGAVLLPSGDNSAPPVVAHLIDSPRSGVVTPVEELVTDPPPAVEPTTGMIGGIIPRIDDASSDQHSVLTSLDLGRYTSEPVDDVYSDGTIFEADLVSNDPLDTKELGLRSNAVVDLEESVIVDEHASDDHVELTEDDVIWVSAPDTKVSTPLLGFANVADRSEPSSPETGIVHEDEETEMEADQDDGKSGDMNPNMDGPSESDTLTQLLSTWRRGAYEPNLGPGLSDVAGIPGPSIKPTQTLVPLDLMVSNTTDTVPFFATTNPVEDMSASDADGFAKIEPMLEAKAKGSSSIDIAFSLLPTGTSEMTLQAVSTNHEALGCLPILLELTMLVSAMRGMKAETPGPDTDECVAAILETKSASNLDNTVMRLCIGSQDAPRVDVKLQLGGMSIVRTGENPGDNQITMDITEDGSSRVVVATRLATGGGRAVVTLQREVLQRAYGEVRFINQVRLQLIPSD